MRIVIDLQGAQAGHAQRGIGRYSLSLAQAMARSALPRGHQIIVALNGAFADTLAPLRQAFDGLLPMDNIRVWQPPQGVATNGPAGPAERIREAFLASLSPDMVHLASMFEGPGNAAVTSCGVFAPLPTAVTVFDLIPLVRQTPYLDNPAVRAHYLYKVEQLRRADLWLAISEATRQEALRELGLPPERCTSISSAVDAHFQVRPVDAVQEQALRARLGLPRPFVMYTGGIDPRKNIDGLIRAWAALPQALRQAHQLAIVCSTNDDARAAMLKLAQEHGLAQDDVVLTGYVAEDDLVSLYNLCRAFIFPSLHEGFGLPALEAMSCGAAVIASGTSSLPEVLGREDALFDPADPAAITARLQQVLTDEAFRSALARHGLERAKSFSWDISAGHALDAMEAFHAQRGTPARQPRPAATPNSRPRLAFVSPLPPERSGIADYSAQLLPELARHYEIDVVVAQPQVGDGWVNGCLPQRSTEWFLQHAQQYDRVLYHFGNSSFHQHMFELLRRVPGVVVLHDFFLSGIQAWREANALAPHAWTHELMLGHGYQAVARRYLDDINQTQFNYPASFSVLQQATGVIVHSPHSQVLARQWYGDQAAAHWALIPLLREAPPPLTQTRAQVRQSLGVAEGDFLVCSFGLLGPTKQNDRLARAWQMSRLGQDRRCKLVFVGENHSGEYGRKLAQSIALQGGGRVQITGWASADTFRHYLESADLAVQLRGLSRGETSAAVLDCMNHGVATIVNANGSMAYLPPDSVFALPDDYTDEQLAQALDTLWQDTPRRQALGEQARALIRGQHAPAACAASYAQAIEAFDAQARHGRDALLREISLQDAPLSAASRVAVARAVARNLPAIQPARQLLVDISELVQRDAGSGIQRVVKSLLRELIAQAPQGLRIEPVYAVDGQPGYRYARQFTLRFLGCPDDAFTDDAIDFQAGDIFLGLDLQPRIVPQQSAFYDGLRHAGVRTAFVVYDLLPVLMPQHFVEGAGEGHARWLREVARADALICISRSVADELSAWLAEHQPPRPHTPLHVGWFHLGADVQASNPPGAPQPADMELLARITARPSALMVGTLEPRKGHALALSAFEELWSRGTDFHLVIVGKQGWMTQDLCDRLRNHAEQGKRLFWMERASDAMLEALYAQCSALLAASEGEGFGLPLIEAAQKGLPLIVRDIAVFREVAGDGARYFTPETLVAVLQQLSARASATTTIGQTWRQSADQLIRGLSTP